MATTNDELKQILLRIETKIDAAATLESVRSDIEQIKREIEQIKTVVHVKPKA